jgi:hypothetical protein
MRARGEIKFVPVGKRRWQVPMSEVNRVIEARNAIPHIPQKTAQDRIKPQTV